MKRDRAGGFHPTILVPLRHASSYALRSAQPPSGFQTDRRRLNAKFAAAEADQFSVGPQIDGLVVAVFEDDVGLDAVAVLEDAEECVLLMACRLAADSVEMPGDERLEAEVRTDCRAVAFRCRI